MSKAFTRESDDGAEDLEALRQPSPLPPGVKNYITPEGVHRLREELRRWVEVERPRHVGSNAASGGRQRLQRVDQQIAALGQILNSVVVVEPPPPPWEQVRFGAAVSVRDRRGVRLDYQIVGVEEMDVDAGRVSWLAPISKALLNARVGQKVRFRFPSGEEELEILSVSYTG